MYNLRVPVSRWCRLGCFLSFLNLALFLVRAAPGDRAGLLGDFCLLLGSANTHYSCKTESACGGLPVGTGVNVISLQRSCAHFYRALILLRPWARKTMQERRQRVMCGQVTAASALSCGVPVECCGSCLGKDCQAGPWGQRCGGPCCKTRFWEDGYGSHCCL